MADGPGSLPRALSVGTVGGLDREGGLVGVLIVDDLQHRNAAIALSDKTPKPDAMAVSSLRRSSIDRVECARMDVIGEILAKCLTIGVAATAAFVITNYALNYY
jgi:hypothetical protein